ncbi:hypothetical protein CC1G_05146 [Coprinopsis cinerea okayama7|uniref:Senescence domain-containing protein n=1 Tax=Coprinopsis cinerea (strain Okayama-7 / 130 / ATCC MYA-4618 / FGSC 9003) TaxID=240176 RepID=A8NG08_COPC7|nr:hypothetical protein CC1G_05146 [Coprinopsis cinerea okayama7\|eukprot:XP_001833446.1 hypothetical protein CC1G_05146 [Coprinopsis cinerea okayama7\
MVVPSEAFALLVLPNVSLTQNRETDTGTLSLECVTVPHPGASSGVERDVYLVLRLNTSETPLDPERIVQRIDGPTVRIYNFYGSATDPTEINLTFHLSHNNPPGYLEDLDTFESILAQYHADLRGSSYNGAAGGSEKGATSGGPLKATTKSLGTVPIGGVTKDKDLRGHLVMVDESTGEVVGQVEDRFRIREDPIMHTRGHENDPVVIEVSEESPADSDANALEAFARVVPPDQQNWITKGATVVSHAISMTTNLMITTITAASNYYINHSTPSPHHSGANTPARTPSKDGSTPAGPGGTPPPLPPRPRALVFLTSERTRKGLGKVHAVSGEAVKVSAKTVGFIDNMIRKAIGANPKRDKTAFLRTGGTGPSADLNQVSPAPSITSSSSSKSAGLAPPAYSQTPNGPPLPPRRSPSPVPPPLPPRLSTKDKVLISADLILSTIDHSTRQLLDTGTAQLGKVMHHKYGEEAAESSTMIANTARNVGLVYVDMRGIGRRALLKRAGKTYVKSKFSSNKGTNVAGQQHYESPIPTPNTLK